MNDRDCKNCKHHTEKGCDSWDCKFEQKMTRKDAIDRLDIIVSKHEVDDVYITLTNEKDYEALKVAINSLRIDEQYELEYEQIEPCEDAISRQAVLEIAKSSKSNWIDNSVLFKRVNELPLVNPQPKTGHWIDSPNGYFTQCSECGLHGAIGIYKHYGWCPKCGAKMVEPQESEDKE